jgi:hypothetical protein
MKKIFYAVFMLLVLVASSCTERTCPTYAKAPVEHPEKSQGDQNN